MAALVLNLSSCHPGCQPGRSVLRSSADPSSLTCTHVEPVVLASVSFTSPLSAGCSSVYVTASSTAARRAPAVTQRVLWSRALGSWPRRSRVHWHISFSSLSGLQLAKPGEVSHRVASVPRSFLHRVFGKPRIPPFRCLFVLNLPTSFSQGLWTQAPGFVHWSHIWT